MAIELGVGNDFQLTHEVEMPPAVLPQVAKLTHRVGMSGMHQLMLQHGDAPTIFSETGDFKSIVKITDPVDGKVYCACGEFFKEILPRVFMVTEIPTEMERF